METPEHEMPIEPDERASPAPDPFADAPPVVAHPEPAPDAVASPEAPVDAPMPSLPPRAEARPPRLGRGPEVEERLVPLESLDDDAVFRLRPEGDVGRLAMDLARLGQAFPVELRAREGGRLQVVTGFRRIAALRFLQRTHVLARVHARLPDEDALLVALADVLHGSSLSGEEALAVEARLESEGRLSAAARDMLLRARGGEDELAPEEAPSADAPASAGEEEEIDADELAAAVTQRLSELNQDLALLAPVFDALEPGRRAELLQQLRYPEALVQYFEDEGES